MPPPMIATSAFTWNLSRKPLSTLYNAGKHSAEVQSRRLAEDLQRDTEQVRSTTSSAQRSKPATAVVTAAIVTSLRAPTEAMDRLPLNSMAGPVPVAYPSFPPGRPRLPRKPFGPY